LCTFKPTESSLVPNVATGLKVGRACDAVSVFERFSMSARDAVTVLALEEARMLNHSYVGSEHILLGLLRESEALAAQALASAGITIERVREHVVRRGGPRYEVAVGEPSRTDRAARVCRRALREAVGQGSTNVDTQHILLAIMSERKDFAASLLLDFDPGYKMIVQELRRAGVTVQGFAD
jgi:ATP-dependent Clp protease ATP-binding subunit ClpC